MDAPSKKMSPAHRPQVFRPVNKSSRVLLPANDRTKLAAIKLALLNSGRTEKKNVRRRRHSLLLQGRGNKLADSGQLGTFATSIPLPLGPMRAQRAPSGMAPSTECSSCFSCGISLLPDKEVDLGLRRTGNSVGVRIPGPRRDSSNRCQTYISSKRGPHAPVEKMTWPGNSNANISLSPRSSRAPGRELATWMKALCRLHIKASVTYRRRKQLIVPEHTPLASGPVCSVRRYHSQNVGNSSTSK